MKNEKDDPLIFQDVCFTYPGRRKFQLHNVNLSIRRGSIAVVLGPNGAGKTTILKIANGRLTPNGGVIMLDGKPLNAHSRREIGQWIGFVPQSEKITFDYTLEEYVCMGRAPWLEPLEKPGQIDREISRNALRTVGMEKFADDPVTGLSGGQSQLVLLARALAQETRILLLDEASSQLDLGNKRRFLDLVRGLARSGKTIILSTHEPDVAIALAEKLILMKDGAVFLAGSAKEILTGENLESIYETPIEMAEVNGKKIVLWT